MPLQLTASLAHKKIILHSSQAVQLQMHLSQQQNSAPIFPREALADEQKVAAVSIGPKTLRSGPMANIVDCGFALFACGQVQPVFAESLNELSVWDSCHEEASSGDSAPIRHT